jgi:hypothetical protein
MSSRHKRTRVIERHSLVREASEHLLLPFTASLVVQALANIFVRFRVHPKQRLTCLTRHRIRVRKLYVCTLFAYAVSCEVKSSQSPHSIDSGYELCVMPVTPQLVYFESVESDSCIDVVTWWAVWGCLRVKCILDNQVEI